MLQASEALRNAMLDAIETVAGTFPKIQIYTGGQPTNAAAAATGSKLAEFDLPSDWCASAVGGVKSATGAPFEELGIAAGSAGYFRLVKSDGSTCVMQGSITMPGGPPGDAVIDNITIAQDQPVTLVALSFLAPMA